MKCSISILTILLMSLIIFSNCVSNHYVPHSQNVPLFTEKKQTLTNLDIGTCAADVQFAHSLTNHFAGMLNYKYQKQAPICLELGAGYFTPLTKSIVTEIYGGIGMGSYEYSGKNTRTDVDYKINTNWEYESNIKSYQAFLQPNIGFRTKENLVIALSLKSNYWYYPSYDYSRKRTSIPFFGGRSKTQEIENINIKNASALTLEPAFTLRFEGETAKFTFQAGTYSTYIEPNLSPYDNSQLFIRIGLNWVLK